VVGFFEDFLVFGVSQEIEMAHGGSQMTLMRGGLVADNH
jgi:hypothetical protein